MTLLYAVLFSVIFICDRVTKYVMYHYLDGQWDLNSFISFDLTFNRGIAWGIFNTGSACVFFGVTCMVLLMYVMFFLFTLYRWRHNYSILAEVFIVAGGLSNIIDRFVYHGVIDFIVMHVGQWAFPVFNVADVAVVIGVSLMGIACIQE